LIVHVKTFHGFDDCTIPIEEAQESTVVKAMEGLDMNDQTKTKAVTKAQSGKKLSLMELVMTIQAEMKNGLKGADVEKVQAALENYDADLMEWKRYALFDENVPYTRNLIASNDSTFNLILLCWTAGKFSPVHDHNGSECFFRMIDGEITEVKYEYPDEDGEEKPLKEKETVTVHPGEVSFINDSMGVHKVGNKTEKGAVTLHCYLPPYMESKCYCDKTSKFKKGHITFYSRGGKTMQSEDCNF
jgi:cysteine dioxygenase